MPSLFPSLLVVAASAVGYGYAHGEAPNSVSPHYVLQIQLSRPVLHVFRDGRPYRDYPVALGKSSTESPIGHWVIIDKQENWGKGFGSRWLGLNVPWGTYGIHGTNRPSSIGHYVSHGCIRMQNADVEALYRLVPIGTPVVIEGNPLRFYRRLEFGNVGADVRVVQRVLRQRGYLRGGHDGTFDEQTLRAVYRFQMVKGLFQDGAIDHDDYTALGLRSS